MFGWAVIDSPYYHALYRTMLVCGAPRLWADVGELACGALREPANGEISITHWCLTKILILLFAQVFCTNIV